MLLFHWTKHIPMLAAASALILTAGASLAAEAGKVTITHDKDVAARTNMKRPVEDNQSLNVTFDKDVASRTNMHREPTDVKPVTVTQDRGVMERTNMGDGARKPASGPKAHASSTK